MSVVQVQSILDKIQTRGYWRVAIRPTSFDENHIPNYSDLFPIVEKNSVRLRGWDYPHIDDNTQPLTGVDWVGQEFECQDEIEVWRLYTSGQFVHFFATAGEWRDHSTFWPADAGWKPGQFLYYIQTVYSLVEIFEFASRLALSPAGASSMHVEIQIAGLRGRRLVSTDIMFPVSGTCITEMPVWKYCWKGTQTELIAQPRELAALATQDLFTRFRLELSLQIIARLQARIGR
jgi:hypothetical protein